MPELPSRLASADGAPCLNAYGWYERQSAFAEAILNPDLPVPSGVTGPDGASSAKRFAVYRNNVVAGLIEVLKAAYPAVMRIVGDEFFTAMARIYVAMEPPRSPIMLDYGASFEAFISTFDPVASIPYLSDVAKLERAWLEAYHEAEALPVDPASLLQVSSESLAHAGFVLHPSTQVIRSPFPVVTIWQMNIDGGVPTALDLEGNGEDALIVRPYAEVEVRRVPAGAAAFIQALAAAAPLTDAASIALEEHPGFDLASALRDMLTAHVITDWSLQKEASFPAIRRPACAP